MIFLKYPQNETRMENLTNTQAGTGDGQRTTTALSGRLDCGVVSEVWTSGQLRTRRIMNDHRITYYVRTTVYGTRIVATRLSGTATTYKRPGRDRQYRKPPPARHCICRPPAWSSLVFADFARRLAVTSANPIAYPRTLLLNCQLSPRAE